MKALQAFFSSKTVFVYETLAMGQEEESAVSILGQVSHASI